MFNMYIHAAAQAASVSPPPAPSCAYPLDADSAEITSTGIVDQPLAMSESFQKGTYTVGSGVTTKTGAHQSGLLDDFGDNNQVDNTLSVIPSTGYKHLEMLFEWPTLTSGADVVQEIQLLRGDTSDEITLRASCGPSFMGYSISDYNGTLLDVSGLTPASSLRVGMEFTPDGKIRVFDDIVGDRGIVQDSSGAADFVLSTGLLWPLLVCRDGNTMSGDDPGKLASIWMITDASQQTLTYTVAAAGIC